METIDKKVVMVAVDESQESLLLLRCAGVLGFFVLFVHASNVADAYGAGVVSGGVGSDLFQRTSCVDAAVAVDDEVVAYVVPPVFEVHIADFLHCYISSFGGGGAMKDDGVNRSHIDWLGNVDGVDLHGGIF